MPCSIAKIQECKEFLKKIWKHKSTDYWTISDLLKSVIVNSLPGQYVKQNNVLLKMVHLTSAALNDLVCVCVCVTIFLLGFVILYFKGLD